MGGREHSRLKTFSTIAILCGLTLLLAGLVVRDIRTRGFVQADYVSLALWIAGAVLVVGGAVLNYRSFLDALRSRRTSEGAHFVTVLVLTLLLAGLLCYITTRRYTRMDWTGKQEHKLHSKTQNLLRSLDRDVEVTILFQNGDPEMTLVATNDMLEEFGALTSHVKVRQLNHALPGSQKRLQELVQHLGEDNLPAPSVIFSDQDTHEIVPFAKIATSSRGPMYPPDKFSGEEAFVGALTKLLERERTPIYALTGHGERPLEATAPSPMDEGSQNVFSDPRYSLSSLVNALSKDNYDVKPLNLQVSGRVPDDCAALIIAGPRSPLADTEIAAIQEYLDNRNGKAIIMVEPEILPDVDSNLEDLLRPYGLRLRTEAVGVFEGIDILGGRVLVPAVPVDSARLAQHPATADLGNYSIWFDQPCPIEIQTAQPTPFIRARELLTGVESTWGETGFNADGTGEVEYDPAADVAKPVVVGAIVEPATPPGQPPAGEQEGLPGPTIAVLGSSLAFTNATVAQYPANRYLIQNTVNWMAGRMHLLGIPPKSLETEPVPVPESRIVAARYIFIGILPGCLVLLGIGVWLLRRR